MDKVAALEIAKCYRTPEGLWGRLLEKNDALAEDGRGVTDSELIKAFMARNIARTYRFKSEIARKTMAVDFAAHLKPGFEDQKLRAVAPVYLRKIDRQLQNESSESNSRWGVADTYGHTRGIPHPCKNGGDRRRNDSYMAFPRNNRYIPRGVNCAVGEGSGYAEDNANYID